MEAWTGLLGDNQATELDYLRERIGGRERVTAVYSGMDGLSAAGAWPLPVPIIPSVQSLGFSLRPIRKPLGILPEGSRGRAILHVLKGFGISSG